MFVAILAEATGVCYHDVLLPDGEVRVSRCQNDVFQEGRPLYSIHQPVMDAKAVEGLGTWERGETGRDRKKLSQKQQGNKIEGTINPRLPVNVLTYLWLHSVWLPNQRVSS